MTRLLFTLCCGGAVALALPALGQQAAPTASVAAAQYEYVTLVANRGGSAILDYGQPPAAEKMLGKQAPTTEQEKDALAVRKLERAILALNYLSSRGWECLGLSNRQQSVGSTSSGSFTIYSSTEYLLRRRRP